MESSKLVADASTPARALAKTAQGNNSGSAFNSIRRRSDNSSLPQVAYRFPHIIGQTEPKLCQTKVDGESMAIS